MSKRCILIGMGGHSKVVADVARKNGYEILGCLDDRTPENPTSYYLGTLAQSQLWSEQDVEFFIAIGNNFVRQQVAEQLTARDTRFATLIDPSAILGSGVEVQPGTLVMPGVILNSDVKVGKHVILNTGATIDHDCRIDDYVHLSPGAHLAGGVTVGELAHVGIGANIIQQIEIGKGSVVGAGSAVIRDIAPFSVAVGVPAKPIKSVDRLHFCIRGGGNENSVSEA